jgi:YHS domain-containing protein
MKKICFLFCAFTLASVAGNRAFAAEGVVEKPAYPLSICVVSGEKLGSMGKSYVHTHEGREVQFCCKGCLKDFNKDPKKYLKKLDAPAEKPKS